MTAATESSAWDFFLRSNNTLLPSPRNHKLLRILHRAERAVISIQIKWENRVKYIRPLQGGRIGGRAKGARASQSELFLHWACKLPCIFVALFVCYSSRLRLRDSLLRPCYDFLLFFTTQTRPVHRETDSGDEKFITPINKIHNPILGYDIGVKLSYDPHVCNIW